MSNITKQTASDLVAVDLSSWENPEVNSSDIIIPSILAMQGLSEFVTDGKAKFGDFVNSLTEQVVGSISKPFEFIPFYMTKTLKTTKKVGGRFELHKVEPLTPVNENKPWEEVIGGIHFKNEKVYRIFGIIPNQTLPCVITFKSTSLQAGKKIATQMYAINYASKKIPPCSTVMMIGGEKKSNDQGTFVVLNATSGRDATKEEILECSKWVSIVKQGAVKVTEEDEIKTTKVDGRTVDDLPF